MKSNNADAFAVMDDEQETIELVKGIDAPVSEAEDDFIPDTQPVVAFNVEEDQLDIPTDEVKGKILELKDNLQDNYIELCRMLYHVKIKMMYESWGYSTFDEYVARELAFEKSKARYLAQIWENLHVRQGDKTLFGRVISELKWTKATIVQHVINSENAEDWIKTGKGMSCEQLRKEVKRFLDKKISDDPSEALESADEVEGTPMENVVKSVSLQLHHDDYLAFCQAVERMQAIQPGISTSTAVSHICRDFMSSSPADNEDPNANLVSYVQKIEQNSSLKLVVIDFENKDILHGMDSIKKLSDMNKEEE